MRKLLPALCEGEGVSNLPALKLGHECGRVGEAASWMVVE